MFTVPSLPTESLYKFLALGGIITIITSTILLVTEFQKIEVDNIKLTTKSEVYSIKNEAKSQEYARAREEWKGIDEKYEPRIKRLEEALKIQEKSKELSSNPPKLFDWEGRKYTIKDGITILREKHLGEMQVLLKGATSLRASELPLAIERAQIEEQRQLLLQNTSYTKVIIILWAGLCILGSFSSIYGFLHWIRMQRVSDEISSLQLIKAQKDLGVEPTARSAAESRFRSRVK